jgi:solute carrier family 35 protein E4
VFEFALNRPTTLTLLQWALGMYGMKFPLLLTSTHMAFSFIVLSPLALQTPLDVHVRTLQKQWRGIVLIGCFMALNIALNNISLLDISLSLNQVIRWVGILIIHPPATYFLFTLCAHTRPT